MKNVMNVRIGNTLIVFLNEFAESNTYFFIPVNEMNENIPDNTGETNQESTIKPILSQTTASVPPYMADKTRQAPIIKLKNEFI